MNNEGIEKDWIVEAKNKLARKVIEGDLWEGSEQRGERAGLAEVKRKIMARDDALIPDEINNVKTNLFWLRENEKANDLLRGATIMHNLLAESVWQYRIQYKYGIHDTNSDSDIDMIEQLKLI